MTFIVSPPAAPVVPPYPALGSASFNTEAYTYGSSMPAVVAGISALADNAHNNALAAEEDAAAAASSQAAAAVSEGAAALSVAAAAAAAGATMWASGNYTFGAVVWSPTNGLNYRRQTAGTTASTTDPATNPAGWFLMGAPLSMPQQTIAVSTPVQLYAGIHYIVTHALADMTMPASPVAQQVVRVTNKSGATTPILRGAFAGVVDDLTLNNTRADRTFTYAGPVQYWI